MESPALAYNAEHPVSASPDSRPTRQQATVPVVTSVGAHGLSRRTLAIMMGLVLALWWLDYYVNYAEWTDIGAIRRLCNMTREDGLASWVQVTQTLLAALTASLIWVSARLRAPRSLAARGWFVVAAFFLYLSVDDGAQVHERIGTAFDVWREEGEGPGTLFPSYAWQILFVPVLGGVGLFMFWFLWRTFTSTRARVAIVLAIASGGGRRHRLPEGPRARAPAERCHQNR